MNDRELVEQGMQLKTIFLRDLCGYREWSAKYQDDDAALIAYLDSVEIMLSPEEITNPHEKLFEELLSDLREEFHEAS